MKIAYVSPYDFSYPGGVNEHITGLAFAAQRQGHQVCIIAADSGYQPDIFPDTCIVARRVVNISVGGATARVGITPYAVRLKEILHTHNFDVIHLHEPLVPGLTWQTLWQKAALAKTAIIGTFHAYHEQPNWFYMVGRPVLNRLFSRLDNLIAVSPFACDFVRQYFPGDYHIIPNGVNLPRFKDCQPRDAAGPRQQALTILFVGRLDKRKGFDHLLDSFVLLRSKLPHSRLKVVGPFDPDAARIYRKKARQPGLDGIEFVGYVPPADLPAVYRTVDIFCAPSIGGESFGIVLLEAMAAGLPVVASDIAGYRAVVTSGREGLLVPPGSPAHLAEAILQLASAPQMRQEMGERGRRKAADYSWDRIIAKTLTVYHNTIDQKHRQTCQVSPLKNLGNT